ncbi:probable LRR receptor-like serine/threonine-protein kinase At1g56130 [Neltuma alba]|uniref:probable LRR receptor-like serine/threonine-protein kinase At1g56130 n=1 Tax=Neltuma alba TaxID=207710 RepID=UPI0010A55395|nr:probable LRR receptor-like serine/threonine-protein kinase At1g56130 [Prosopis alba]
MAASSSWPVMALAIASAVCVFFSCLVTVSSQDQNITTDPSEARTLNSIFNKWGISAVQDAWNISGEVCSGQAIDSAIDIQAFNPFIKCDCSNGICHITALMVYALDVVGEIPKDLWTLTHLTYLKLDQNYLTGSLPLAIGNLTRMQYLSFGTNALSGELPKELGNLTELILLGLGSNNFYGSIPSELGKLEKLEQIYIDSSGLSGQIPPTFANLKNLVTVWASDMELTGRIPDFIGNWSKLTTLRFQGNSFEGSIPSSFSNLTSLSELRISELSKRSSSLAFIRNMTSLSVLVLRNNNISDSIPSNIGVFVKLTQLDLSFNNIRGHIPGSLFNLNLLTHLFLGNNKLSGAIPSLKSPNLLNIDLSYNNLLGNLPYWANQPNLQLNLVANNLTIEGSNSSGLHSGLRCLQQNFPCHRGTGIYYNFAIKCGGPPITLSKRISYERDDAVLGPATYFVTDTTRWAVSNVGVFTGIYEAPYTSWVSNQFIGTLNSELYETARLSASSLRYYGLGLENGAYNISLYFAETSILDRTATWKSLGRRVFDIYIQGKHVLKDFDIKREAGNVSFRAVRKDFRVNVTENFVEIHLFWAGKGTCCIPAQGTYGPLISAISATPDFIPIVSNKLPHSTKNRNGLIVGVVVGVGVVSLLSALVVFYIIQRIKRQGNAAEELLGIDTKPYTFSYSKLKNATGDFNPGNKLGEGGFGPVYKGTINDGTIIAVKQLSIASHQGESQFIAEIATISAVQHRNLVKLYGCCLEGKKRLLVYEYLENKSLDQALFGNCLNLNWPARYDICIGVARGLTYLHEESRLRIVHRDVKASNILLDHELTPKISDFGLAKLYDDKMTHISTRVAGTIGYLAPEYAMRGHLTEKVDVFSFGILALEIVSGRPNSDSSLEGEKMYLLEWTWQLHEKNCILGLLDPKLLKDFNEEEVKRIIGISLLCTQASPSLRPTMSRIVAMLSGDIEVSTVTTKPGYLTDWKFDDVSSFITGWATKGSASGTSQYNSSPSKSTVSSAAKSPGDASKPILSGIFGEGG